MKSTDQTQRLWAISLSFLVGTFLMGLKFAVYALTGSSAVLSDALESIINVVASGFALASILLAAKPPDPSHPYGHGKVEYFSVGFEGALIVFAAVGILWTAFPQILNPHPLAQLETGLLILLATSLMNLALGAGLVRIGRRTKSLVLLADGKHILTDVITSAAILGGLLLVHLTSWYWLDGAVACVAAVGILLTGSQLIRRSFSALMDASDPSLLEEIAELISKNRKDAWIGVHRLRAWRSGDRLHVDFHLILPRQMSLEEAHDEVTLIQRLLQQQLGEHTEALIHAEPCFLPECPICGYDPCTLRERPAVYQNLWRREVLTELDEEEENLYRVEDDKGQDTRKEEVEGTLVSKGGKK